MFSELPLEQIELYLKNWRENKDEKSLETLIIYNSGLVIFYVKKYLGRGLTFDELKSAGNEGLLRAITKFNYKEFPIKSFTSYVSSTIENQIKAELKQYNKHKHVLSFEQPIYQNKDGDEIKIDDIIGTDADELLDNIIDKMKIDIVRDSLKCLTTREKQIILLRYGFDDAHKKSQEEIAKLFGCSKESIGRQERKALVKMRHPRNTKKIKDFIE